MEIWKDVKGFEGKYQASNIGNVRSLNYEVPIGRNKRTVKGRVLNFNKHKSGYLMVYVGKKRNVHRIIGETFIPNVNNLLEINHINGIKSDNRIENLEWCTRTENNRHMHRVIGRKIKKHYKVTEQQVNEIINSTDTHKIICNKYKISRKTVHCIKHSVQNRRILNIPPFR